MLNQKRRTVLKGMSLLGALPIASLSAFASTQEKQLNTNKMVEDIDSSQYIKRVFTLTNLTPNSLTLDKTDPITVPAYTNSSKLKLDVSKAQGAIIAPGGDITFDVIVAKDDLLDVCIDNIAIKSNQSESSIVSAMNFNAQVSII